MRCRLEKRVSRVSPRFRRLLPKTSANTNSAKWGTYVLAPTALSSPHPANQLLSHLPSSSTDVHPRKRRKTSTTPLPHLITPLNQTKMVQSNLLLLILLSSMLCVRVKRVVPLRPTHIHSKVKPKHKNREWDVILVRRGG